MPVIRPSQIVPWRYLGYATLGFTGVHALVHLIGYPAPTEGPSMLPTIHTRGDWIWISTRYRRGRWLTVGDMVAVRNPRIPEETVTKRIIGLQGDFVLRDTPNAEAGDSQKMIQIPDGHCWIAGDNSPDSRDSRDYGPIPLGLIKGKVVARILPFKRMAWLENTMQPVAERSG